MRLLLRWLGLLGLALAAILYFTPGLIGNLGSEALETANRNLSLDLLGCETPIFETEAECRAKARATHARAIEITATVVRAIPLGIGGFSLLLVLTGFLGQSKKPETKQVANASNIGSFDDSVDRKLSELEALQRNGKITDAEYKVMRQNILSRF